MRESREKEKGKREKDLGEGERQGKREKEIEEGVQDPRTIIDCLITTHKN